VSGDGVIADFAPFVFCFAVVALLVALYALYLQIGSPC
jgi:hypothetical protein